MIYVLSIKLCLFLCVYFMYLFIIEILKNHRNIKIKIIDNSTIQINTVFFLPGSQLCIYVEIPILDFHCSVLSNVSCWGMACFSLQGGKKIKQRNQKRTRALQFCCLLSSWLLTLWPHTFFSQRHVPKSSNKTKSFSKPEKHYKCAYCYSPMKKVSTFCMWIAQQFVDFCISILRF